MTAVERGWYAIYCQRKASENAGAAYRRTVYGAERRGIDVELDRVEFETIADSPCTYCGVYSKGVPGLDRIDNRGHYTEDNVVSCCKHCNWGKGTQTALQYINRCDRIATLAGRLEPPVSGDIVTVPDLRAAYPSWAGFCASASKRSIRVNINSWEWMHLTKMQCHYCQISDCRGLDRLDPYGIYEMNNIVPCCGGCNKMKMIQSLPEFLNRCTRVASYSTGRPPIIPVPQNVHNPDRYKNQIPAATSPTPQTQHGREFAFFLEDPSVWSKKRV
jgi:hypothetical protein